jgi:type I restriction enzyme M protein
MSDWGGENLKDDVRWKYSVPPAGNANFAWVQHIVHHLAPNGIAGFVLANGSMTSNTSGEGEIRKNIVDADLVDCMVALPTQLFFSTPIPACLWFLTKNKKNSKFSNRPGRTLFIDARKSGVLLDRVHRELTAEEITHIAGTYHSWRGEKTNAKYRDIPGFCKSLTLDAIREQGYVLTPSRHVASLELPDDEEAFEEKAKRLTTALSAQLVSSRELDQKITRNLKSLGIEI